MNLHPNHTLLQAKEDLVKHKQALFTQYEKPVLSLQANMVGEHKLSGWSSWVIITFEKLIQSSMKVVYKERIFNELGFISLLVIDDDPSHLKQACIQLEETHPCGRCIDLDVYAKGRNLSRYDLGFDERKCLVCDEMARVCIRTQKHTQKEVIHAYQQCLITSFQSNVDIVHFALLSECMLTPKFGLVTPLSNGIHHDMNIHTFLKSIDAILPYFNEVEFISLDQNTHEIFSQLRLLGQRMENAMFEATQGVNTYKGAIFLFLMVLMAQRMSPSFTSSLIELAQPLLEDFKQMDPHHPQSEGERQFHQYQSQGVRGWVLKGGEPLLSKALAFYASQPDSHDHQVNTLLTIMSQCEDSTIIKKRGWEGLLDFQAYAQAAMNHPESWFDFEQYCLDHHFSAGGSADIFALVLYLHYSKERNLL